MTLLDLQKLFSTDDRCREILTKLRWPDGVTCPRCKGKDIAWISARKQFDCRECEYQFSVMSGTIFNDSHLPLQTWFMAVLLLVEARKGFSANQMKRTLGVSYKTAWYLCHRIRAAMKEAGTVLDGTLEIDETYIGGKYRGYGRTGPHTPNKEIVVGIRQRGGDLRLFHTKNAKSKTLAKYIKENVSADVDVIVTDEWPAYPKAMIKAGVHGSRHKTIQHKKRVYVMGDVHTNTVESAFSLLKRGIIGTWHRVSKKHLAAYLDEMCFRFNRRKRQDLFVDTLRHMVTADPLTFEKLTA